MYIGIQLLLFICDTDAITNAGGTSIKYIDVNNGTDISSYGNIIGGMVLSTKGSNSQSCIFTLSSGSKIVGSRNGASGFDMSFHSEIRHRVFYF